MLQRKITAPPNEWYNIPFSPFLDLSFNKVANTHEKYLQAVCFISPVILWAASFEYLSF